MTGVVLICRDEEHDVNVARLGVGIDDDLSAIVDCSSELDVHVGSRRYKRIQVGHRLAFVPEEGAEVILIIRVIRAGAEPADCISRGVDGCGGGILAGINHAQVIDRVITPDDRVVIRTIR